MKHIVGWYQTAASIRNVQQETRGGAVDVVDRLTPDVIIATGQAVDQTAPATKWPHISCGERIQAVVCPYFYSSISDVYTWKQHHKRRSFWSELYTDKLWLLGL